MDRHGYSTVYKIDLDNVVYNYETVRKHVAPSQVIPVLKGNAYGHGAVPLAKTLVEAGCRHIAVSRLSEALELRSAGIGPEAADIVIMGGMLLHEVEKAVEIDASFFVHDWRTLEYVREYVKARRGSDKVPRIHIKVDTGMGRFGFMPEEGQAAGEALRSLTGRATAGVKINGVKTDGIKIAGAKIEGVATHLAAASEKESSQRQLERFDAFLAALEPPDDALIHVASSSAVARFPTMFRSSVRVGDLIYGFSSIENLPFKLRPALSCVTTVMQVKRLPPGWHIGYGVDRPVRTPVKTATVAMGTTDGLMTSQAGRSYMLIHGTRCKLLAVCADSAIVDVSAVDGVEPGDAAVYIGCQGDEVIGALEQARAAGVGFSELLAKASSRTPRIYLRHGKRVGEMSSRV